MVMKGLVGAMERPQPVVICGPSGVGKGTLIGKLMKEFPETFGFSVSHTTRKPRAKEVDGVHYHFATRSVMAQDIEERKFLESAEVHGNLYGTSWAAVKDVSDAGKICILDIDVQGAQAVKKSALKARYIFVKPPAPEEEELEKRLRGRGTETEEQIQKRLNNAKKELERAKDATLFDHILVNANLEEAFEELKAILGLNSSAAPAHSIGTAKHLTNPMNGSKSLLNGCSSLENGSSNGSVSDHYSHGNGSTGMTRANGHANGHTNGHSNGVNHHPKGNGVVKLSTSLPSNYNHTLAILTPSDLLVGMHSATGSPRASCISAS